MPKNMPKILDCKMNECSYNKGSKCHAMAITVGDSMCPECDTFIKASRKGGIEDMTGSVGACKMESCRFNDALECSASEIHVGRHSDHAECSTFAAK